MAQIIVASPSEMRRFSGNLGELASEIGRRHAQLLHMREQLAETWKDAKYAEFSTAFDVVSAHIPTFIELSKQYVAYLNVKAAAGEKYQGR